MDFVGNFGDLLVTDTLFAFFRPEATAGLAFFFCGEADGFDRRVFCETFFRAGEGRRARMFRLTFFATINLKSCSLAVAENCRISMLGWWGGGKPWKLVELLLEVKDLFLKLHHFSRV